MFVNNLSQLKKALASGTPFQIVEHFNFPERAGEKRVVQKMQTNGMYTGILGNPNAKISTVNGGLGSWIAFGKASDWTFCNGLCHQEAHGRPVWTIRLLEEEASAF